MNGCKLDHDSSEGFPAFLCRVCSPELIPTDAKRQEWADRVHAARERTNVKQELLRCRAKVAAMCREGEPDPCYVPIKARVYASLVAKERRLAAELQRMGE